MDLPALVEVFRSPSPADCEDRAFVLAAVQIPSQIAAHAGGHSLHVAPQQAALAAHHLWHYAQEQRRRPPAPAPLPAPFPLAWVGSGVYAVVLALVALAVVLGWGPPDLFVRGMLESGAVRGGQWWRAITALTLHIDRTHLVSNLGAGAAIGYFAARQMGAGTSWLLIVVAASASNFVEAWLGVASHRSVGASTAVFAALGILAAHTWRTRHLRGARWARNFAPLVAGTVLLGLLGSSGEGTNLVAHVFGFAMGLVTGWLIAAPALQPLLRRLPQWVGGAAALGLLLLGWALALGARATGL